jgi:hypothetical protein
MGGNVLFGQGELADSYALITLYDYIKESTAAQFAFPPIQENDRCKNALAGVPRWELNHREAQSLDLIISTVSDVKRGGTKAKTNVDVDIAILKNCVLPMPEKEKAALREKYGIGNERPIVVVGYADSSREVETLVKKLSRHADLYLVGPTSLSVIGAEHNDSVHAVRTWGVLKDYYAIADLAINAHNLEKNQKPMHNFVEATEGGPLLMVPPENTMQYGYHTLVDTKAIVECKNLADIISRAKRMLKEFQGNEAHNAARTAHLMRTRENYLPVIEAYIRQALGEDIAVPQSDLDVVKSYTGTRVRIMHPETDWDIEPLEDMAVHYGSVPLRQPRIQESTPVKAFFTRLWAAMTPAAIKRAPYNECTGMVEEFDI